MEKVYKKACKQKKNTTVAKTTSQNEVPKPLDSTNGASTTREHKGDLAMEILDVGLQIGLIMADSQDEVLTQIRRRLSEEA